MRRYGCAISVALSGDEVADAAKHSNAQQELSEKMRSTLVHHFGSPEAVADAMDCGLVHTELRRADVEETRECVYELIVVVREEMKRDARL